MTNVTMDEFQSELLLMSTLLMHSLVLFFATVCDISQSSNEVDSGCDWGKHHFKFCEETASLEMWADWNEFE